MDEESLRKKIIYKSSKMGCKENDIIIGKFIHKFVHKMNIIELKKFDEFLNENDNDIYNWVLNKQPIPEKYRNDIFFAQLKNFILGQNDHI